ncbi:hypothetical protein KSC_081550 [Ktedonobacter sp. SOSP1-52]|nr:hypothetical protein KSC_081550 [Ktedonobacter sp. SOSP1-52]
MFFWLGMWCIWLASPARCTTFPTRKTHLYTTTSHGPKVFPEAREGGGKKRYPYSMAGGQVSPAHRRLACREEEETQEIEAKQHTQESEADEQGIALRA